MDISQGEKVEGELDILIRRRDEQRQRTEGERLTEELWMPSERAYFAKRQEDNRVAWCDYHRHLRTLHQGLADEHDDELKKLENGHHHDHKEEA